MSVTLKLNPEQQRAVEHGEGPLLVIAGPGSGKTRVITQRIVYLLETVPGLRPENILALTFTDKAAGEMKHRVHQALPQLETAPHISTFHSFCYEVLRKRHFERRLLDKVDVWIFLRRRMEALELEFYRKLAEPGAFLHALNDFFSRCQDELIEPDDFEAFVSRLEASFVENAARLDPAERKLQHEEIQKKKELAGVFRRSQRLIEEAGCSSLGSLIPEAVRLFGREREVLNHYRQRFKYVLVDEFQDTNYAQVELLRRLVAPPFNITAVGDDDQAIYRFRGAAHGAFEMFADTFKGHQTIYLNRNYRSTKKILHAADVVIAHNERYEKKPALKTEKPEGSPVYLLESPDYVSEAAWIAQHIEDLARKGTRWGDIAVLYRAHAYRDLLAGEFRRRKILFTIRGLSILSTVILRDLLAYLNLIHSPHDNISLTRVLLAPRWRFPEELSFEIRRRALKDRCSLYDVLEGMRRSLLRAELDNTGWPELRALMGELSKLAHKSPVTSVLDELVNRLDLSFLPGDPDQTYVNTFRTFLEKWEKEKSETGRLQEFMEYFQYFRDAGGQIEASEPEDTMNAVQMMTVHAAKGLEFPVVFILSVAPRRFPHSEQRPVIEFPEELRRGPRPPANIHLQEERRLFYVAMTRAQERLYVSSVVKPGKKPARFIEDLLSSPVVRARDIETIRVPAVAPPEPIPTRVLLSETAPPPRNQPSLFTREGKPLSIYPNLADWIDQPVPMAREEKLPLSATAIEDYQACPLKFKFGHYLKVPTGPQAALTFGNIMHQCVRHYFELRKKGLPRFEDIEAFYLDSWKTAGFEDEYQEQAYRSAGLEQLRAFVERHNGVKIEAKAVRMEERFQVDLGDVVLEGRVDQIQPIDGRSVELVDYKTGRPRSQKDADGSLQLSVYALAAREHLKLNPARLTFYNLATNEPVSTARTSKDLEEVQAKIREVAEQIRQEVFPPKPGFACKYCEFVPICPAHEEIF